MQLLQFHRTPDYCKYQSYINLNFSGNQEQPASMSFGRSATGFGAQNTSRTPFSNPFGGSNSSNNAPANAFGNSNSFRSSNTGRFASSSNQNNFEGHTANPFSNSSSRSVKPSPFKSASSSANGNPFTPKNIAANVFGKRADASPFGGPTRQDPFGSKDTASSTSVNIFKKSQNSTTQKFLGAATNQVKATQGQDSVGFQLNQPQDTNASYAQQME